MSPATISRHLTGPGSWSPSRANARARPTCGSPPNCPTNAGNPTSPTTPSRRHRHRILTWLDDHSRYALRVTAHSRVTGPIVLAAFRAAIAAHGAPASTLTDNGMVFTTRFSGGRGGRNGLENELRRRGITQKNGKANHPQTQGKVERFQQTLKKWLAAQPPSPPAWPSSRPS